MKIGGYIFVDHTNSPGLPHAPGGKVWERDTLYCPHCGGHFIKNPLRERPRNFCRSCNSYVCDKADCNIGCLPKAKVFDKAESMAHKNPAQVEETIRNLRRDILGRP